MSVSGEKRSSGKVTIKIPRLLYNRLSEIVKGSGFNSVTDFVVYVLRDLASTSPDSLKGQNDSDSGKLSPEEIEAIRKRLKSLGYL